MKEIENKKIADYIITNNATLRNAAKHFNISRQTVCNRMKIYDNEQVNNLLQKHFKDKAKNGGLSRKNKSKRK